MALRIVLDARATTAYFPGVARATLGLLTGLAELEHPHQFAVLRYADAPPPTHPAFADPRFQPIATDAAPLGLAQQWRLPRLARALQADVWHAPYYIRPFAGVPRPIVTVFDVIGHMLPEALPSLRARLLFEATLRWSLRGAAHVITTSEATKRDLTLAYHVPAQDITVIPLAVNRPFRPQAQSVIEAVIQQYGLPARYVLYLGSNKPHKNLSLLVRAFAEVQTDAALVIAGRWDQRYQAPKAIVRSLGLAERVRFLHDVADADLPALLGGALAFVFPSRYEGFGLPPLEAMACGAPVIAANTTSLPEVVGDAGLLVQPSTAALANAIQTVLDDAALRQTLRERGLARAQLFSWVQTARQTIGVYERYGLHALRDAPGVEQF